jgi:Flp pilus assembly protein TadD
MTLLITLAGDSAIHQSSDYRLSYQGVATETANGTKQLSINGRSWMATVGFTGIATDGHGYVTRNWLHEESACVDPLTEPTAFVENLTRRGSEELKRVIHSDRRLSFIVAVGMLGRCRLFLVSNFEVPQKPPLGTALDALRLFEIDLSRQPLVLVHGASAAVPKSEKRILKEMFRRNVDPRALGARLAATNRLAASRYAQTISQGCWVTSIFADGTSQSVNHGEVPGMPYGTQHGPEMHEFVRSKLSLPPGSEIVLRQQATARSEPSDEYHLTHLRNKPEDPSVRSNYGAFLQDHKGDMVSAEREYRKAIELDPTHVNALGNLANLLWDKRDTEQAGILYRRALAAGPGNENVTWNYARFLLNEVADLTAAREVLDRGVATNANSSRLLLLRADLRHREGNAPDALEDFRRAKEQPGNHQAEAEAGYACILHVSDAPIDECVVAYRIAIGLNPNNSDVRLNLAQLLFVTGDNIEANRYLREAMKLGLSEGAQLEANFYLLAHTTADPGEILRATKSLLDRGIRLQWNVRPNVDAVRKRNPRKADLLERVSEIMAGERDQSQIEWVLAAWDQD